MYVLTVVDGSRNDMLLSIRPRHEESPMCLPYNNLETFIKQQRKSPKCKTSLSKHNAFKQSGKMFIQPPK